jgi:predicted amidophosphoribosyltransferase
MTAPGPRPRRCVGCKTPLTRRTVACLPCWRRLPEEIRTCWAPNFTFTSNETRVAALIAAVHWFRDNPLAKKGSSS